MPTFENGWICRECWSANREQDQRCYRCHAVPKRREMPEPATFSTPDGRPNEERKKVSSLTGPAVARAAEARPEPAAPAVPAAPAAPPAPRTPLGERLRNLGPVVWVRAIFAAFAGVAVAIVGFARAVVHAPGAGLRFATETLSGARRGVSSGARSAIAHRRIWLGLAWVISGLSCALLFSAALRAPFAASLLVVAGVAIFSGLSAAIVTGGSERLAHRRTERPDEPVTAPGEHPAQPADLLGSRIAH